MGKLPSGYIELNYIESTGTQYIDTEFKPNNNTRITCCFSTSASNTSIFGAQSAWGTTSISFGGNTVSFGSYGNTALILNDGISHKIDFDKGNLIVDGATLCSASGTFQLEYNMYVLANNEKNTTVYYSTAKLYYCQIYDNGIIIRDYVPCINPSGIIGLYDLVNAKFYSNAGTGGFVAGEFVEEMKLPSGYAKLEYIESNGTQYIDTGFKPNQDTRVIADMSLTSDTVLKDVSMWFGATNSNEKPAFMDGKASGSSWKFTSYYSNSNVSNTTITEAMMKTRTTVDHNKNMTTWGGITNSFTVSAFQINFPMYLFGVNLAGVFSFATKMKLYSCQIYDNNTIIRNFIPCINPYGEIGLYDSINNKFYGNAGSGVFITNKYIESLKLPDGYTKLKYIESSGTQYIDTGFCANQNTRVVMDVQSTATKNAARIWFGARKNGVSFMCGNNTVSNYAVYAMYNTTNTKFAMVLDEYNTRRIVDFNKNNITMTTGQNYTFSKVADFQMDIPLDLFGANDPDYGGHRLLCEMRLYECKIYDNGTIARSFIPCINPNGIIGLYDLVNSKFYSNTGAGVFTAGDFAEEIKLPSRYTKLEYIKSGGVQYIDTKFAPNKNTRVLIKTSSNESGNNNVYLFGCDEGHGVNAYGVTTWTAEFENNKTSTAFTWHDGLIHKIDFNKGLLYIDETLKWSSSSTTLQTSLNMYLFAANRSGTAMPFNGKIYSCQIYDNGILIRNYIPCFDNVNNKIGLYDSVNNEFYENIGQGEFTSKGNYYVKNIRLPSDYIKLNYIESTGVQYIDTNFIPNQDSRVIIDHAMIGPADGADFGALFGTQPNPNDDSYMYLIYKGMTSCQTYFDHEIKSYTINSNGRHFLDANKNIYYLDGIPVTTAPFSSFNSIYPIYLFAYNNAGTATAPSKARIYSCKIYNNNTLKRFFVPCLKKSTGEIGLYDIVENNFHNNKGTGNFLIKENYLDYIQLPNKYIKLKYIESNGYQYIDTGLKPNQNTKINILAEPISISDFNGNGVGFAPYGASTGYDNLAFECYSYASKYSFNYGNGNYSGVGTASLNNLLLISQDNNQNSVYNFCTEASSNLVYTAQTFQTNYNLLLFGINRTGKFLGGSQKIYQCQIYNNNNILHNFIPCINPDNEIGMFDIITQSFYKNKGTKAFSPGPFAEEMQLPKDYIKLEYIEATGTQYIDTDFKPNQDTSIVIDFQTTQLTSLNGLVGSRTNYNSNAFLLCCCDDSSPGVYYFNYATGSVRPTTLADLNRHTAYINKNQFYLDGTLLATRTTATFQGAYNIYILAANNAGSLFKGYNRVYSCQIYDNGTLIRNYVPCKNSNNKIGLYDIANEKFYENAGSGTFIAGPEAKYYKLDYIASNGKQYIDTGVIGKINTKTSIDFQILSTDLTDFFAIGSAGPNYTPRFYPVSTQYDKWSYGFNGWQNSNTIAETGQRYFIETNLSTGVQSMRVDEAVIKNSTTSTAVNTNLNMFLFSSNMNGVTATYPTAMKLYECKIYRNGDLIRNFTPVIRSDGEIGLFDSIQYAFYTNKGLESFEAGNIIDNNTNSLNARCKIDNVWKNLVKAYVKIDGQWKEIQQLLPITKK